MKLDVICKNCGPSGSVLLDSASGDEVCQKCGLVASAHHMSEAQEWRTFANSDDGAGVNKSRVGGPTDAWMSESSNGTTIVGGDFKFNRLMQVHEAAVGVNAGDRQLKTMFGSISAISSYFNLPEGVIERSKDIIKSVQTSGQLKNRTGILPAMAIVYLACRAEGSPRTLKDLANYDASLTEKEIGKAINRMKKLISVDMHKSLNSQNVASGLVPRFAARLALRQPVIELALRICTRAEVVLTRAHRPNVTAAAALILAANHLGDNLPLAQLAAVSQVAQFTLTNVHREFSAIKEELLQR